MRFVYLIFTVVATILIPVFSVPVSRGIVRRALFSTALKFSNVGDAQVLAAQIGTLIGGPPEDVCRMSAYIFGQLDIGESATGATTVGDRAVVGMRKMLGLQDLGTDNGVSSMMDAIMNRPHEIAPQTIKALQELVANPIKTLASLQAYKDTLDLQNGLSELINIAKRVNADPKIEKAINTVSIPAIKRIETTIDKIGGDFSVQKFDQKDVDDLLNQLKGKTISSLKDLPFTGNKELEKQLGRVEKMFTNVVNSVNQAASIPDSARKIPQTAFSGRIAPCKPMTPPGFV